MHNTFVIETPMLPFILLMCLGAALFHTIILNILYEWNYRPKWLFFLLDPLIVLIAYVFFNDLSGWVFLSVFGSVFVLGIFGFIFRISKGIIDDHKQGTSWWKILLSIVLIVLFFVLFWVLNFYIIPIIFFIVILLSILPNRKSRFYFYQRTLPTSKIKSVAMGLSEIEGIVKSSVKIKSPISDSSCVGYIYTIDDITVSTDDDGRRNKSYREIFRETKLENFYIEDDTGSIEIRKEELDWIDFERHSIENNSKRYTEILLLENQKVLLVGNTNSVGGKAFMEKHIVKKVFAMAPSDMVIFANQWRPLKIRVFTYIIMIVLMNIILIFTPIKQQGTKLIIESPQIKQIEKLLNFDIYK